MTSADEPTRATPAPGPEETQVVARPQEVLVAARYRLDALIGRGGTAEVWRAMDTALGRTVALKLVTVAHDESSARAADEARTLAQLSHPSLVQVYDAGTDDAGRPWVVMELVDGETLADEIRRGTLPAARVADVGLAVAEGLDHVHARGLVHRDVKPANVLVGRTGRVRLTDFGIARLVDAAKVTSTGMMVGTASYLAPEQVAGEPVGPAADVYSLGLTLLEALTGRREYDGGTVEVALARLNRPPYVPADLPGGWPPLLAAMTGREAARRPTAAQAAGVLRSLAAGTPPDGTQQGATQTLVLGEPTQVMSPVTTVAPRTVPLVASTPAVRATRRGRLGLWLALLLLAAVVAAGVVALTSGTPSPRVVPGVSPTVPQPLRHDLEELRRQATTP